MLLTLSSCMVYAQVLRTEFVTYETREDALAAKQSGTDYYVKYNPLKRGEIGPMTIYGQKITVPASWGDYCVYMHVENVGGAYDVAVNDRIVFSTQEGLTPRDLFISGALHQGENDITVVRRDSSVPQLGEGLEYVSRAAFEGSAIYLQRKAHIWDYEAAIIKDPDRAGMCCRIDAIVKNGFNGDETVKVGYDLYGPDTKLIDYGVIDFEVGAMATDTLRITIPLGNIQQSLWSAAKPVRYRAMLYVKRDGKPREYIPFRICAGQTEFKDGSLYRNGQQITLKKSSFSALSGRQETINALRMLRKQGVNTVRVSNPQPEWFYNQCELVGMYVIEQVAIAPAKIPVSMDRAEVPANDPTLLEEYICRTKAMYYRTRNHNCIIAYSLGSDSGANGYCLYKAYQWLKSVEKVRPVILYSADGEWNTDLDSL